MRCHRCNRHSLTHFAAQRRPRQQLGTGSTAATQSLPPQHTATAPVVLRRVSSLTAKLASHQTSHGVWSVAPIEAWQLCLKEAEERRSCRSAAPASWIPASPRAQPCKQVRARSCRFVATPRRRPSSPPLPTLCSIQVARHRPRAELSYNEGI